MALAPDLPRQDLPRAELIRLLALDRALYRDALRPPRKRWTWGQVLDEAAAFERYVRGGS